MNLFLPKKNRCFDLTDRITIIYTAITGIILLFNFNDAWLHILIHTFILTFIFIIGTTCNKKNKILKWTHRLYPLVLLSFFFPETDYINNIFTFTLDPLIINIENNLFGYLPSDMFSLRYPYPWFSELMHLGYFSFYPLITFFVFYYYYRHPELAGKRVFTFFFSFYFFYLIFIFFPSEGPHYFLNSSHSGITNGYIFSDIMKVIIELGDRPTGAFPSSHVGITWIAMSFFYKDSRKIFLIWFIPATVLTFSTVYIKAHYALDVAGGFLMVPLFIWLGNTLYDQIQERFQTDNM